MSQHPKIAQFLARNKEFAKTYIPDVTTKGIIHKGEPFTVIVCCTDVRVHPQKFFGLKDGEAMIVPNAGGRVTDDVLRTLYTLDVMSDGGLGTVIVAQHTGCGMGKATEESLRAGMKARVPGKAKEIEAMWFGVFTKSYQDNIRDEMAKLKSDPYLGKGEGGLAVLGYLFDLEKGTAKEVEMGGGVGVGVGDGKEGD
ncbi:hypothetical protein N7G274_006305 [Stereocaulon virgatum]|uniref:Carbonic anhydrase n=1 Tax=Stereocaulon virgatum TaxID=373712 RepID=A0ABR4A8W4_9LECA